MRKLKEILRLKYGLGLSHRQIARSLVTSPSVVSRYTNRAAQPGIKQRLLPVEWDDAALKHAFLQTQVPCLTVWLADDVSAALAVWQGYLISARVNACNYSPKTPPFFFKIRKTVYC